MTFIEKCIQNVKLPRMPLKNLSRLIQMIRMGKSICHKWVKDVLGTNYSKYQKMKNANEMWPLTPQFYLGYNRGIHYQFLQSICFRICDLYCSLSILINPLVTNGLSHPYHLDESTFIYRVIGSNFHFY